MEELQNLLIKLHSILVEGYNTERPYTAICEGLELLKSNKDKIYRNNYEVLWAKLEKSKQDITILTEDEQGKCYTTCDVVLWDDIIEAMRIIEG